jgi:hypothetical protein
MIARSRLLGEVFAHIDAGTTDLSSAVGISPGQVYFSGAHPSLERASVSKARLSCGIEWSASGSRMITS